LALSLSCPFPFWPQSGTGSLHPSIKPSSLARHHPTRHSALLFLSPSHPPSPPPSPPPPSPSPSPSQTQPCAPSRSPHLLSRLTYNNTPPLAHSNNNTTDNNTAKQPTQTLPSTPCLFAFCLSLWTGSITANKNNSPGRINNGR